MSNESNGYKNNPPPSLKKYLKKVLYKSIIYIYAFI